MSGRRVGPPDLPAPARSPVYRYQPGPLRVSRPRLPPRSAAFWEGSPDQTPKSWQPNVGDLADRAQRESLSGAGRDQAADKHDHGSQDDDAARREVQNPPGQRQREKIPSAANT